MIRPLTCLCLGAAFLSGLYLYAEKHRAELLDRQIAAVMLKTEAARMRSAQLDNEWQILNQPGRLKDMAGKYISELRPMAPAQFVRMESLADHLPAPEAAKPETSPDEDAPVAAAAEPMPAPPDAAPAQMQVAGPVVPKRAPTDPMPNLVPTHAPIRVAGKIDAKPRHVAVADAMPHGAPLAHGVMLPLASPQPVNARVLSAMARPMPTAPRRMVSAAPAYVGPSYIGSAIGTGREALPAPVPLGAGEQ